MFAPRGHERQARGRGAGTCYSSAVDAPTVVFATHNAGKLAEMRSLLARHGLGCVGAAELGLVAPIEDGATFAENAALKARAAYAATGLPTIADDSGLVVPALGGAPGVHTARFASGPRGFEGAIERLGAMLGGLGPGAEHRAELVSAVCLVGAQGDERAAEAHAAGRLVFPPRGDGPGFEPIFELHGARRTLAELDVEDRLRAHPRSAAVAALADALDAIATRARRS